MSVWLRESLSSARVAGAWGRCAVDCVWLQSLSRCVDPGLPPWILTRRSPIAIFPRMIRDMTAPSPCACRRVHAVPVSWDVRRDADTAHGSHPGGRKSYLLSTVHGKFLDSAATRGALTSPRASTACGFRTVRRKSRPPRSSPRSHDLSCTRTPTLLPNRMPTSHGPPLPLLSSLTPRRRPP